MSDDVDRPAGSTARTTSPAQPSPTDPAPVIPPAEYRRPPAASGPRPASKLEITGWVITALGVLVLVYFALTRSVA